MTRKCKKNWRGKWIVEVERRAQRVTWSARHATCRAAPRMRTRIERLCALRSAGHLTQRLTLQRSTYLHFTFIRCAQKCTQLLDLQPSFCKSDYHLISNLRIKYQTSHIYWNIHSNQLSNYLYWKKNLRNFCREQENCMEK